MNNFFDVLDYAWGQFRGIVDIIDIALMSAIIFFVIKFIKDRRAGKLAMGVIMLFLFLVISNLLDMRAMSFVFSNITQIGIISLIVLFQPELRSALEKIGGNPIKKIMGEQRNQVSGQEVISNICRAVSELAQEYTGALIVIERSTHLGDIIKTGTIVNADVEVALIKNIFYNKAPLHDGAMVIRLGRICSAGCFLPLSTNDDIIKDLGTRHRSAIGMSENSDAVIIVVSEETGTISIAVDGQLRRNYDYNTLKTELSSLLGEDSDRKSKR